MTSRCRTSSERSAIARTYVYTRVYIRCALIRRTTYIYMSVACAMATAGSSSVAAGNIRRRVVLTIEAKLNICNLVKGGRSSTSAATEFNVVTFLQSSLQSK